MDKTRGRARTRLFYPILLALLSSLLMACGGGGSGGNGDGTERSATNSQTSTGNDAGNNQQDTSQSGNQDIVKVDQDGIETQPDPVDPRYRRPAIYPRVRTLPLQFITTSKGHKLGVYVSFPADAKGKPIEGKFPVIMTHSAYNLGITNLQQATGILVGSPDPYLIKRGYITVAVDSLGSGSSSGGWEMLGPDEQVAYGEAVDWVRSQPWFGGKLGMAGASYMAISSLFAAEQRPDGVDAIFALVPMGDPKRGTVGIGGTVNALFLSSWVVLTHMTSTQNIPAMLRFPQHYNTLWNHTQQHIDQIDNYYIPKLKDIMEGAPYITYDSEFWRERSPLEHIDRIKAPTMILGGLSDIFQRDEPLLYEALKKNTDSRLVIYDGGHLTSNLFAGGGNNKVPPLWPMMLQWFDHYLLGMDTGIENIPPVTQYVKNYNSLLGFGYASTTDWPHPQAKAERWYLHGDNSLSRTAPTSAENTLDMEPPTFGAIEYGKDRNEALLVVNLTFEDGTDCSPSFHQWTLGAGGFLKPKCMGDVRKLEERAVNYETAPMDEDYYINGPIQADIWMETSGQEAVLAVRVDEVAKNGRVTMLSSGMLLASTRAVDESRSRFMDGQMIQPYHYLTEETAQPVVPGQIMKMQVEVFPTSVLIRKGSKLRISLAPSNQAMGVLNYPRQDLARDGINTIHHSPEHPSSLVVPVVPVSALN